MDGRREGRATCGKTEKTELKNHNDFPRIQKDLKHFQKEEENDDLSVLSVFSGMQHERDRHD